MKELQEYASTSGTGCIAAPRNRVGASVDQLLLVAQAKREMEAN